MNSQVPSGRADLDRLVSRKTLADHAYARVRAAILNGELAAGTEVNQAALAQSLGVSRVPIREALRRLQAERLLVANPFHRYVVRGRTPDQLIELFELREELEVFGLRRAVRRADFVDSVLPAAREASRALRSDMAIEDWLQADRKFHRALNGSTTAVADVVEDIRDWIHRGQDRGLPDVARREQAIREHQEILDRLASGDTDGAELTLRRHIHQTRQAILIEPSDDMLQGSESTT